jgi:excisionase family DNA binding protein
MNQAKPAPLLGALVQRATGALLTTEEAAGYLNIKPQTLNNWRVTKKVHLPFIRVGRLCRYRMEDLDAFIAARTAGKIEA